MIIPLSVNHTAQIAKIHEKALSGDFLPSLGAHFLKTFYAGIVSIPDVYGFVYQDSGEIKGFIVGTVNSERFFFKVLSGNFIKLSFLLMFQLVKKPSIIKNIFETFLYPKKETGPKAELVIVAVSSKNHGKGIGKKLIHSLEDVFKKRLIKEYKLSVHADKKAMGFYKHLGYSRISSFHLYGKIWYVYAKKILC